MGLSSDVFELPLMWRKWLGERVDDESSVECSQRLILEVQWIGVVGVATGKSQVLWSYVFSASQGVVGKNRE